MRRRDEIPPIESGLYVAIAHPANTLLLRGCALITPYRAGFEDCLYARIYANPFQAGTVAWSQYDHGNIDARMRLRDERSNTAEVICDIKT